MLDARVVAYVSTNGSSVGAAAAASAGPFWERPLDGGGALRFGKDSLYHTRLVIIISAPHWIGRPKKTTRAGAAAFVVVVRWSPETGGRGCAVSRLCSLSPPNRSRNLTPTLSAGDSMLPLLSRGFARACAGPDKTREGASRRRRPTCRGRARLLAKFGSVRSWSATDLRYLGSRSPADGGRPFSRGKSGRGPAHAHAHTRQCTYW